MTKGTMAEAVEVNYDGLVGPTHNYSGLSAGNIASQNHGGDIAYPRKAALQGLNKMKILYEAGFTQGVLPPQERPFFPLLHALGFSGDEKTIWEKVWRESPFLARNLISAATMWTANAAAVSPGADTEDGRLHLTPANLLTMLHRSVEAGQTHRALRRAFPREDHVVVHEALPPQAAFADEGAANHVRLCAHHGAPGIEIFVYGRSAFEKNATRFPARQTLEASQALARLHGLKPQRAVFVQQSAKAIDAGAFHNDVVCVGTRTCLFFHEEAFEDKEGALKAICAASEGLFEPEFVEVPAAEVPLEDAIQSYLFNAQLLVWPGEDRLVLLAPLEVRDNPRTRAYCEQLVKDNGPIGRVHYVDVRQSMANGGGPACLRLRVVMTPEEQAQAHGAMLFDEVLYDQLTHWVKTHYRESLAPEDLADPALPDESRTALEALTDILGLGQDFYPFQRGG